MLELVPQELLLSGIRVDWTGTKRLSTVISNKEIYIYIYIYNKIIATAGIPNHPWGCPAKVPKKRSRNKYASVGEFKANGSTMGP